MTVETRPVSQPTISVSEPRWPDIQGLRAVAVVLAATPPTRYAGLGLFLVISGYVVTRRLQRNTLPYRKFGAERIRRLTPAPACLLLAVQLLAFFLVSPLSSRTTGAGLLLVGALTIQCLVLPLAVVGALRFERRRATEVLAAMSLASATLALTTDRIWPAASAAFAAGALLAVSVGPDRLDWLHDNPVSRVLARRPLTWVGDRSYSVYLWQWPIPLLTPQVTDARWAPPAAALLMLLPAWLTHRYVEQRRPSLSVCAAMAAVVVACGTVMAVAQPLLIDNLQTFRDDEHRPTFAQAKGCLVTDRAFHADDIERCTVRVPHARGWILLAGDDHAASFSTGVIQAAKAAGFDTVSLQGDDCPFARTATSEAVPNCRELSSELLDRAVGANPPNLAIVTEDTPRPTLLELRAAHITVLRVRDVPTLPCRGGYLLFRCTGSDASDHADRAEPDDDVLDAGAGFCRRGTCSALLNGHLAYADAEHLNAIGSASLEDEFEAEITATEPGSVNLNSTDRRTAPR